MGTRRYHRALVVGALIGAAPLPAKLASARSEAAEPLQLKRSVSPGGASLEDRVGLEAMAERLRYASAEREQIIERLGRQGTEKSLMVLDKFLDSGQQLTPRQWLVTVRALAANTRHSIAREWLFRIMVGVNAATDEQSGRRRNASKSAAPELTSPLQMLARQSAALALAKRGKSDCLRWLRQGLSRGGPAAKLATEALRAYPPAQLKPLLESSTVPLALPDLLARLGDQRGFHPLRGWVRRGVPELQARSALALLKLGHLEVVPVAEHWLEKMHSNRHLLAASTEILLAASSPRSGEALAKLSQTQPETALQLALRYPTPDSAKALRSSFAELEPEQRDQAIAALGRAGGKSSLSFLGEQLSSGEHFVSAAFALAHSPDAAAHQLLLTQAMGGAAAKPKTKTKTNASQRQAAALRALVVREFSLSERSNQTDSVLQSWAATSNQLQRAVAVWGLSVRSERFAIERMKSGDANDLAALLSTARLQPPEFFEVAAQRLSGLQPGGAKSEQLERLLSIALIDSEAAGRVPTWRLVRWLDAEPALSLAATLRFTERDDARQLGRQRQLLQSPDSFVRAAALRGLGQNKNRQHTGTLVRAYEFETDPRVRLAIVQALRERPAGAERDRVLRLAQSLDPDDAVRALARQPVSTRRTEPARFVGREAVWTRVSGGEQLLAAALLEAGETFPVVVPADGNVVLLGLPVGKVELRLAVR